MKVSSCQIKSYSVTPVAPLIMKPCRLFLPPQIPLESRKTKIKKTLSEICIGGAITLPSGEMFVRVKHLSNWKDIGCYYATEDIVSNIRMFIELETINPMAVLPDPRSFVLGM